MLCRAEFVDLRNLRERGWSVSAIALLSWPGPTYEPVRMNAHAARLRARAGGWGAGRVRRLTITRTIAGCTQAWWCSGLRS
jgi:hypothetical protein